MSANIVSNKWFNIIILILVTATFVVFNYQFRTALLMGFILAVLTYPISNFVGRLSTKYLKSYAKPISIILTMLLVTVLSVLFVNFLAGQLVREIPNLVNGIQTTVNNLPNNENFINNFQSYGLTKEFVESRVSELNNFISSGGNSFGVDFQYYLNQENLNAALNIGQQAFNVLFNQIVYLILFYLAWYNALMYGDKWLEAIFIVLPFKKQEKEVVTRDLEVGVRNVIYANILSGIIHTAVSFVMMLLFGVENIFIISLIIFLIGFLPASPSEIGYAIPIAIVFTSNPAAAIILAIIAELVILWTNYLFLPKIILAGNEGNPLFVVTSVLVGLEIFGLMGFLIGPVIMIFINTLAQILLRRIKQEDKIISAKELAA
ncbi:MAG: AI-2E family transporter [Patescibacteria group bacterium]